MHLKVVRMISLATFSIVLLKLVLVDLWLLPTIGKVVVFIILGVILLVLSFRCNRIPSAICIKPARLNEIEKPALNSSGKPN